MGPRSPTCPGAKHGTNTYDALDAVDLRPLGPVTTPKASRRLTPGGLLTARKAGGMTRVRSVAELVARRVAAVLALVTLVAALGITCIALIQRDLADYRERVTPLVDVTNSVRLTFTRGQVAYRGYLATGRPEYLPPYHEARQNLATAQARFDELTAPAIPADALARVRQTTTDWARLADQGIRRTSQGQHIDLEPTTTIPNAFQAALDRIERQVERFRTERRAGYTGLITLGLQLTVGARRST